VRALLVALLLLSTPALAFAQGAADPSRADVLFEHGLAAFEEGRIDEACANFEDSLRLDPADGTLINLARCHERQGKIASAWAAYEKVAQSSARAGNQERARVARAAAQRLEPLVSAAPPQLDGGPRAEPEPATQATQAPRARPDTIPPPAPSPKAGPMLVSGIVIGSLGAASVVAGAILGAISLSDLSAAEDDRNLCPQLACSPAGRAWVDAAETKGHASTGLFVLGGVLAATGIVLVSVDLTTQRDDAGVTELAVVPLIGPGNAGVQAGLTW